jgi:hypothetical protein
MHKIAASLVISEVFAEQPPQQPPAQADLAELIKQMNLKQNAMNMFKNMKIDTNKFTQNSGAFAKELGFENGFNLHDLDLGAHDMAKEFGVDNYLTQFENQAQQKLAGSNVQGEAQKIFQHMQQKAANEGLGGAFKDGMAEALAASQNNPEMRDALSPLKQQYQHYKQGGMKGMMYDGLNVAAHNPMVENMLEQNGVHVNDLLTKFAPHDNTGKAGLETLMDHHREQVENEFDSNNSHFSYFFAFVIFVVLCAIAVALYEIYELKQKKKGGRGAVELTATGHMV